jgi:hypothetical protein
MLVGNEYRMDKVPAAVFVDCPHRYAMCAGRDPRRHTDLPEADCPQMGLGP